MIHSLVIEMFMKSNRISKTIILITFLLAAFSPNGCRKEKNIRRIVVENACGDILKYPSASERTKILARKVLRDWGNKTLDPKPVLIHAGYLQDPNEDFSVLVLHMSDEEFDIKGFGVREFHKESDVNVSVVVEDYPIFPNGIGHHQFVRFQERKTISQRKDNKSWQDYVNNADLEMMYRRDEYPVIWISLPSPPTIEVEIWVYDYAGRKSEPVPLEHGLPDRPLGKTRVFDHSHEH
jgi:hypothetical protein